MAHGKGLAHARTRSRAAAVNSARWQRTKALFQAALEHAPAERAAFVAAAVGDDDELRREVESLLAADAANLVVSEETTGEPADAPDRDGDDR